MINPNEITRYSSDDDNIQLINTLEEFCTELEIRISVDFILDNLFINTNGLSRI